MLELQLAFDFQCCACGKDIGVTLKCAGNALATTRHGRATVKVPCPSCQEINQLCFALDGTLYDVQSEESGRREVPEPSCN